MVRGTNWVGDAVMTIPALRELRRIFSRSQITLATRSSLKGLFKDLDCVDDILTYDRTSWNSFVGQASQLKNRKFDLAVLFQNAFEAALIARLARVPLRIGYGVDGRSLLLTHTLELPAWHAKRHEIFYYLNIVAEIERLATGDSTALDREPKYELNVSAERAAEAKTLLNSHGIFIGRNGRPLVALCPGSTNSRAKRWPSGRFAELADRLVDEIGADVVLIGGASEKEVSRDVATAMTHDPVIFTGETTLEMAVAILSLADLLVTNDTGPAHIAAALSRPTLVIFGPTDPTTTRPYPSVADIIRNPPDCAPCMLRDCPIDHRCMTAITVDQVFARASAMMNRESAEARA